MKGGGGDRSSRTHPNGGSKKTSKGPATMNAQETPQKSAEVNGNMAEVKSECREEEATYEDQRPQKRRR